MGSNKTSCTSFNTRFKLSDKSTSRSLTWAFYYFVSNLIMSTFKDFAIILNSAAVNTVNLINTLFFLQKICITVEVSERSVEKLLAEVSQLKEEIKRKKQQNSSGKLTQLWCKPCPFKVDPSGRSRKRFWTWGSQNSSGAGGSAMLTLFSFPQEKTKTTQQSQTRMSSFVRHCKRFSPILDFRHALLPSKANTYPGTAVT